MPHGHTYHGGNTPSIAGACTAFRPFTSSGCKRVRWILRCHAAPRHAWRGAAEEFGQRFVQSGEGLQLGDNVKEATTCTASATCVNLPNLRCVGFPLEVGHPEPWLWVRGEQHTHCNCFAANKPTVKRPCHCVADASHAPTAAAHRLARSSSSTWACAWRASPHPERFGRSACICHSGAWRPQAGSPRNHRPKYFRNAGVVRL